MACLGAFAIAAWSQSDRIPWSLLLSPSVALAAVAATLLYVFAAILVGGAWYALLWQETEGWRLSIAIPIALTAQFGKYLPGNVAQFFGRIVLAKLHGFGGSRAIATTAFEGLLATLSAVVAGGIGLAASGRSAVRDLPLPSLDLNRAMTVALAAVIAAVAVLCVRTLPKAWRFMALRIRGAAPTRTGVAASFGLLILANVLVACALQLVARSVSGVGGEHFGWILWSMAVAWTLGYLTPGAPGGLGVRDGLLVVMLAPVLGQGPALGTAMSFRVVTTLGDLIAFLGGLLGQRLLREPAPRAAGSIVGAGVDARRQSPHGEVSRLLRRSAEGSMRKVVRRIPILASVARRVRRAMFRPAAFTNSTDYWRARYARGDDSGAGSYAKFGAFKAEVLNAFTREHEVASVIEFGCGDGNQLSLASYPSYIGVDISEDAVRRCRARFAGDPTKVFMLADAHRHERADLALSLDVIYHLIEDDVFDAYMTRLFDAAERYVIIYSSDTDENSADEAAHVKHRRFSRWIADRRPEWTRIVHVGNRYPYTGDPLTGTFSEFHVYERRRRTD